MSTTQRDELAAVIVSAYGEDADEMCPCEQDFQVAEAILAAGYRKLRTITTVEELEALPDGITLRCGGVTYEHNDGWFHGVDGSNVTAESISLPAAILWEPEAGIEPANGLEEIKARAHEALAHRNDDPSVCAEMAWHAVGDQARLLAALEAVQAGLSGLDEIFNGDSGDDAAIRAIVDGLRAAMAEALS